MAEITAATVKALREATNQGMMECKKALEQANGDLEAAKDLLRKKGLDTAVKKAGRETKEGMIAICLSSDNKQAAMVEIQCETDFCARNDVFREMVKNVAGMALKEADGKVSISQEMQQALQSALAKTGENMGYARGFKISAPRVGSYTHHNNKVGVLVGIDGQIDDETLSNLCMHIAFSEPVGISTADIPADLVAKEREIAQAQAAESGKPAEIVTKMVEGKVNKYLAANALMEQPWVRDDKQKVKEVLKGAKVTVFVRYSVGG
jgi:elongation factor Ts